MPLLHCLTLFSYSSPCTRSPSTLTAGNIAFYSTSTSTCQAPPLNQHFTPQPRRVRQPFQHRPPLNTTIESYINADRPTCSDGHIPTFYTYQDEAYYQGAAEWPEIGLESDTSCVKPVQFLAMTYICSGFGDLKGNAGDDTGGDDGCESDGGNEEGNDEGGNYNGCSFGVGTGGDGVHSNDGTADGCNGLFCMGCAQQVLQGLLPSPLLRPRHPHGLLRQLPQSSLLRVLGFQFPSTVLLQARQPCQKPRPIQQPRWPLPLQPSRKTLRIQHLQQVHWH